MYAICVPTSIAKTHITFKVLDNKIDAEKYVDKLIKYDNFKSKFIKKWGEKSYLVDLKHELYQNTRSPHIETDIDFKGEFTVLIKNAYVYEIKK